MEKKIYLFEFMFEEKYLCRKIEADNEVCACNLFLEFVECEEPDKVGNVDEFNDLYFNFVS